MLILSCTEQIMFYNMQSKIRSNEIDMKLLLFCYSMRFGKKGKNSQTYQKSNLRLYFVAKRTSKAN